jgi:hypothetical protein
MNYYCFDFHGSYLGYVDQDGSFFDRHGNQWARLSEEYRVYDLTGRERGRIDVQGSLFAEDGSCLGYLQGWVGTIPTMSRESRPLGESRQPRPSVRSPRASTPQSISG